LNKKYFGFAIIAALLFGVSTPISKLLLERSNPVFLASLFYLGAAFFLLPFSRKEFKQELRHIKNDKKDVYRLIGAIFFGGVLGPVCLLFGIKMINATSASLLLNLETVATTFLAWIFFKEGLGKRVLICSF